jgi:hypothetical protein
MANLCLSCHFTPLYRKGELTRPMTLTLRTMNRHAQLMGWGDHWERRTMWCLIKANQLVASTKKCMRTPGGAGQSTRAHTRHHHRTMASPKLSTQQSKNLKPAMKK